MARRVTSRCGFTTRGVCRRATVGTIRKAKVLPGPISRSTIIWRLQAEFDNYKKRTIKEQTALVERATQRLVERLLPVLDDFDRALAHSDAAGGVELVYKQLKEILTQEGLEEIPAAGRPFDPLVHEAIESIEDETVSEPVCKEVYRTGYRLKGKVIRPAMVVVARPPEREREDAGG
jgi:molecular chaperone GrpE